MQLATCGRLVLFLLLTLASGSQSERDPPECPPEGEEYFPDPDSCEHYYVCVHGNPVRLKCPAGLYWSQENKICDSPENVYCPINSTTISTAAPTTSSEQPRTTSSTDFSTPYVTTTTEPSQPYCDPDLGVYTIPFYGNCSKYYLCLFGERLEMECAPGLIFDPSEEACVREDSYDCPWNPTTETILTTLITTTSETTVSTNPTTTITTTSSTSTSTTTTTTTTRRTTTTTDPTNPFPCPDDELIYLPHPETCNLFYLCVEGEFRGVFACSADLWFHSVLQGCVNPEDSDCTLKFFHNIE